MKKPYRLLIIDDSEEILAALTDFFTGKKYTVFSASNGLDGLKLLETEKMGFDLIITDIVMPHISGIGVISIVKDKYPNIPVIAITGWGENPEMLAAEAQADRVMKKPFDLTKLDVLVKDLITDKNNSE
jgi:DNA-binding response OmpR family regulator